MTIQSVEPDVSFSDDEAIHLYQIIRELLFNVLKHGQTNAAEVLIQRPEHDVVEATVKDKGLDFDPAILAQRSPMDRFGLFSVREPGGTASRYPDDGFSSRPRCNSYTPSPSAYRNSSLEDLAPRGGRGLACVTLSRKFRAGSVC